MAVTDMWTYGERVRTGGDLSDYTVQAEDGDIGKIDDATYDVGSSYIVVDTGPWIFGKKVMIPAGVIREVDHELQTVVVERTKDEIKRAPMFDEDILEDASYRGEIGRYYASRTPSISDN